MDTVVASNQQQNKDDEDPQRSSRGFPFLELPAEIRQTIYRHLLRTEGPTDMYTANLLHPQIMCTCRQILVEGRGVLYGENVLQIDVWSFISKFQGIFFETCCTQPDTTRNRFLRTKQFEIVFEGGPNSLAWHFQTMYVDRRGLFYAAARTACRLLCKLDHLQSLSLDVSPMPEIYCKSDVVQAFAMLRNVSRLTVHGVLGYAVRFLEDRVHESSPVPNMYWALEKYTSRTPLCCEYSLATAYDAAENNDIETFKQCREDIIAKVDRRITHAKDHIFDHDPEPNIPLAPVNPPR